MRLLLALLGLMIVASAQAAPPPVPASLEPWRAWVLKDQEFRRCPLVAGTDATGRGDFVCAWPGTLRINADADGAELSQRWRLETDGWVPLAGDDEHWPQRVTVDGIAAPVIDRDGPALWLTAGNREVRARLDWSERPQTLQVPVGIALIALSVDGKPVTPLQRDNNQLTLGRGATTAVEADSIDLRVFRKFSDDIPGELTTQIRIQASGQAREEVFGPALPAGFLPLALESEQWPARLDDDGGLRVQVRPGSNTLTLTARAIAPIDNLVAHLPEDWAAQEIWSYESMPSLRVTSISGAVQVDPRQADVPREWIGLPAYALADGEALTIEQRSRGTGSDMANRLNLQREAWLDFSGAGWFVRDRISGRMQSGWRLDVAAPFVLQRAAAGNQDADALLITRGAKAGTSGVEWRTPAVNLQASSRIDRGTGSMPISGWQQIFDEVRTNLHLPYGYRLIAAPGTDRASGSWLSRWTLLDVFIAAIVALLAMRLLGWAGGALAAAYLVLSYQESGAPLWTLLAVLALSLLVRALPAERLARATSALRWVAFALLVVIALPFAAQQIREAIYPQLESAQYTYASGMVDMIARPVEEAAPPPAPAAPPMSAKTMATRSSDALESITVTGSRIRRAEIMAKYSETTVVQTGPGEPAWQLGNQYTLNWNGPVLPTQEVRLIVAPPWLVRPLRIALVGLLVILVWRIAAQSPRRKRVNALGTSAAAIILSSLLFVPTALAQDYPPDALLQQLRERLTEAPRCAPSCADIAQAQVSARGDEIRIALEIHAAERVAVPLPADANGLSLRTLTLDGLGTDAVVHRDGKAWLAVDRGVHRVELVQAASADKIALAFAMAPHRVVFSGEGWQASGLADQRLLTETLTLVRARESGDQPQAGNAQQFAPYVRVMRELQLDLEWSVDTRVQRLAPRDGGFTVSVPTISGEHVSTPGFKLRDGNLTAALADGAEQTNWHSTLDQAETLTLTAPALTDHAEVWYIAVSPTWHVDFSGVPETGFKDGMDLTDMRQFTFHPLPGETLNLRVSKPAAIDGATRAIDKLALSSDFGQRASTHTLRLDMRASQGGEQVIGLPANAEVLGVTRDGAQIAARAIDGKLSLPLKPGAQIYQVSFQDNSPIAFSVRTPAISLGVPAANIDLAIDLPDDRWLLAAFGPPVGPAVLFWGELLVMIVLAWLLSRWWHGQLRFHHWLLLGLGFSTFSWLALAVVVVWLFALDWRARRPVMGDRRFNLMQFGLAALTVVALGCLLESIRNGLLGKPDMMVSGNGSSANHLLWFADRSVDALPTASVISLPLWIYNLAMLVWALWLAWAAVGWLRSGFAAWTAGGYWRPRAKKATPVAAEKTAAE